MVMKAVEVEEGGEVKGDEREREVEEAVEVEGEVERDAGGERDVEVEEVRCRS